MRGNISFDSSFLNVLEEDKELKAKIYEHLAVFTENVQQALHESQMKRYFDEIPAEFTKICVRLTIQDERKCLPDEKT